jgi:SAM-dependent methyltransferase
VTSRRIVCALCGGAETRRLYTKWGHDIARCTACGLVYANPRASAEAIHARYSADYFWKEYLPALGVVDGRYDLAAFDRRYAPLLTLLGPGRGRRLLEIGSGAGFFLKSAERCGWAVEGFDLSEAASRFAREELALKIRSEPADAADFGAGIFDGAAMFDTIEHLFDPRATLTSIARALVPRGCLLIGTPNFDALSVSCSDCHGRF